MSLGTQKGPLEAALGFAVILFTRFSTVNTVLSNREILIDIAVCAKFGGWN